MASSSHRTTDHETIKKWVEFHGGKPSVVKTTHEDGKGGLIRINFPGYSGEDTLEEIGWDEFFTQFDESELAFLYQDKEDSRFFKFVKRDGSEEDSDDDSGDK